MERCQNRNASSYSLRPRTLVNCFCAGVHQWDEVDPPLRGSAAEKPAACGQLLDKGLLLEKRE